MSPSFPLVRTWTATDACGNQSVWTQTLSVVQLTVAFVKFPKRPDEASFMFSGPAGARFALDRRTNATTWVRGPVLQIDASGTLLYLDQTPNSPRQQFFRVSVQP